MSVRIAWKLVGALAAFAAGAIYALTGDRDACFWAFVAGIWSLCSAVESC